MKKLFAVVLFLCMFCTCAFAESTALSWENVPEETQAAGQFTQIALADDLALLCWIPANMAAVDVSTIETEVSPVEAYQTEDGTYTVSIFALVTFSTCDSISSGRLWKKLMPVRSCSSPTVTA